MKKMLCGIFVIFILFFAFGGCDNRSEKAKLVHNIMGNVTKTLEDRYQLHYIGMLEAADKKYYNRIGLSFQIFRVLSKDEGRNILLDSSERFLKEINADLQLQPFLKPSPFTLANIEMTIYVYHPDGSVVFYPDISVFSARKEMITFDTEINETRSKLEYYTHEKESYEEALSIVRSQNQRP